MSEAPPAYHEVPYEDHAAQLEQMKAMMEQMRLEKEHMRLEKERLETEAKRKAEEEAVAQLCAEKEVALHAEQEELRELAKKCLRQQDEAFKLVYKPFVLCDDAKSFRASIAQSENMIFYAGGYKGKDDGAWSVGQFNYIITNKNVYQVKYHPTGPVPYVIYTFNAELKKTQILFLNREIATGVMGSNGQLEKASFLMSLSSGACMRSDEYMMLKKFESIIRLIPGSYKNGDWKQLDGFVGMYFNETTMELSEVPPPSL